MKKIWPLGLLCIVYILLRSFYWDVIPIWDARWYYSALLQAKQQPFDILNYGAGGHLSQLFFLIIGSFYFFFQKNYYLFNLCQTFFGVLSVVGFYYLLKYFSRNKISLFESVLMTAVFAFHPTIFSGMVYFSLDIGMLVFFMFFWLMVLYSRPWLAAIGAFLMIFSKEPAILLLPLPLLFSFSILSASERWLWLRKNFHSLALPVVGCVCFLAYKVWGRSQAPFWELFQAGDKNPFKFLKFFFWHPSPESFNYLAVIFILNFNWILSLLWVVLISLGFLRRSKQSSDTPSNEGVFIGVLFLATVYLLTLFRGLYTNSRYLMIPVMLMIVGMLYWLWRVIPYRYLRISILVGLLGLFLVSNFRTVDPLSRALFGVFPVGKHEMLSITKPTKECCGYGRDQLVYNLEFLNFPRLLEKAMQDLKPTEKDCFLASSLADYEIFAPLDKGMFKMTFQDRNIVTPRYMDMNAFWALRNHPPETIFYVAFPNVDNSRELMVLFSLYKERALRSYNIDGYELKVVRLSAPVSGN